MEQHLLKTEQMESLKALSHVNVKISEAKNLLFKLQEEETDYLVAREKKAMDRIQKVVDDSKELIKVADENHSEIKALLSEISAFVSNLLKIQEDFQSIKTEFEERNIEWERDIGQQQDDIAEIYREQDVMRVQIKNDKKSLESARKKLADDQKKLDSDRGTIERTIERLKKGKI